MMLDSFTVVHHSSSNTMQLNVVQYRCYLVGKGLRRLCPASHVHQSTHSFRVCCLAFHLQYNQAKRQRRDRSESMQVTQFIPFSPGRPNVDPTCPVLHDIDAAQDSFYHVQHAFQVCPVRYMMCQRRELARHTAGLQCHPRDVEQLRSLECANDALKPLQRCVAVIERSACPHESNC